MRLVLRLAELNCEHGGGPFGAGVFNLETGALVAPGVNLVVASNCSIAHAEIVALSIAQMVYQTFDLGAQCLPGSQLVTSVEPCAMCLGAIPWSGVASVVSGATDVDARAIGFDEGPKPNDWVAELEARGVRVQTHVMRKRSMEILTNYAEAGGVIYNGRPRR